MHTLEQQRNPVESGFRESGDGKILENFETTFHV
jgi:hypothetical protein